MQIGTIDAVAIELSPVEPGWRRDAPSDRGPWARFELWVDGVPLTAFVVDGTREIEPGPCIPLAPLADWLVRNRRVISHEDRAGLFPTSEDPQPSARHWARRPPPSEVDQDTWDDARYAWTERHFLRTGGDGSWLPESALVRIEGRPCG